MKKKLLVIVFFAFVFSSNAQTEAGTKMLGGNAGFSFSKDKQKVGNTSHDQWRSYNLYLNPNAGIFVIDKLAVGALIGLESYTNSLKDGHHLGGGKTANRKNTTVKLALGPWVRYYYPVGDKGAVFGELNTLMGIQRTKYNDVDNGKVVMEKQPVNLLTQIGIGPGYTYFLTKNVGIEGLLQYHVQRASYKPDGGQDRIRNSTGGLYFNIGLQVYL